MHTLSFDEGRLGFDGRTIAFPATAETLAGLLGPASRSVDNRSAIAIWDDLGVQSRSYPGSDQVIEVDVGLQPGFLGFRPKSFFIGEIILPGGRIRECSTAGELRAAGFREQLTMPFITWRLQLGRFAVLAHCNDGVSGLCFSWRGPEHVPGPLLAPDELFSANSRDYGFAFDETLQEVERRGNVSVLRHEIHGRDCIAVRCLFEGGALGELGRRRGYAFMVILDDRPTLEGDRSDDPRVHTIVLGLLHDPDADLALEFPRDLQPGRTGEVTPTDLILDLMPEWPDGGKRVAER
jgi:hypothetical protein